MIWVRSIFPNITLYNIQKLAYVYSTSIVINSSVYYFINAKNSLLISDIQLKYVWRHIHVMGAYTDTVFYTTLRPSLKNSSLRKRLRISSVFSVNYHYITVLCPFNLLIRFKCYNTV